MFDSFFPDYFEWWHLPVVFLAGLLGESYGSVIGGGGIIIQSALVYLGVPIKASIATGTAGGLGTEAGIISATRQQIVANKKLAVLMTIPFTIGSILGVWLLVNISPTAVKYIMIVAILLILGHTYAPKLRNVNKLNLNDFWRKTLLFIFMLFGGLYGKIGPGEGTFSKFALMSILGLSFIKSQGLKAVATVPGRLISVVVTTVAGLLVWPYAVTLWVATFIAARYATKVATKVPDEYLENLLALVSVVFVLYLLQY